MWKFWELADGRGRGEFSEWRESLSKADRGYLDEKLRTLRQLGPAVSFWKGVTGYGRLNKLRIHTPTRALRPIVCRGPAVMNEEITLLFGAFEVGDEWDPLNARERADERRTAVIKRTRMRIEYKVPEA